MHTIIALDAITKNDTEIAGGKGANLGELLQAGFPVPPGFVVTASAYRDCLSGIDFKDQPTAEIRSRIVNHPLPKTLSEDIQKHHGDLKLQFSREFVYAVRSSATAEDLGDASFAGQHDTYYYVKAEQLDEMIKKCWASLWSDAACSYRDSQGIAHAEVAMAVVVQVMIEADISGITFTANPVTGNRDEWVTEASWGMGAAIVDGRVSPDQYQFNAKTSELTSKRIADKKFMVPAQLSADASRLEPVPEQKRREEALKPNQLDLIHTWAERSQQYFKAPQDLEWSFEKDQFYILQSRPITTLTNHEDPIPAGKYVLFKSMAENFTDPLLPLSEDLYSKLFPILTLIRGRAYLNLGHLQKLLPLKLTDEQVAELAYLSDVNDLKPKFSFLKSLGFGAFLYINYLLTGAFYNRTSNMPDDFMSSFRTLFKQTVADDSIDAPGLMFKLFFRPRFFEPVGNMVIWVNLSAPRYIMLLELLSRLLKYWLPDLRDDAASYLTSGSEGVLSTEMGRGIWQLAEHAKASPEVADIISRTEPRQALPLLREANNASKFLSALNQFLAIHGHRTLKEFELNSVRWEEDPSPVTAMVRNYLQSDINPSVSEAEVAAARLKFCQQIQTQLKQKWLEPTLGWRWRLIEFLRRKTKYYIRLRENSRFYHIMVFYGVRLKVLKLETELLKTGKLKCKDDVFYLRWPELQQLQAGELTWLDVEARIRERRMQYIRRSKTAPAKTYGIQPTASQSPQQDLNRLIGQGASPGVCEGIAKVIMDPSIDATVAAGEILVAPYTDPAWTPLFLTASAAVVEVGSYLSHAGTIAREYGMPCVVDTEHCTSRIKTGDRIRVDGSEGVVTLLKPEDEIEGDIEEASKC